MSKLSIFLLLADIAVLIFVRFRIEYAWLYWLVVAMILPFTLFLYLSTFHITRRDFAKRFPGSACEIRALSFCLLPDTADQSGEKSQLGRLGTADGTYHFLGRVNGKVQEIVSFSQEEIDSVVQELPGGKKPRITVRFISGKSAGFTGSPQELMAFFQ